MISGGGPANELLFLEAIALMMSEFLLVDLGKMERVAMREF